MWLLSMQNWSTPGKWAEAVREKLAEASCNKTARRMPGASGIHSVNFTAASLDSGYFLYVSKHLSEHCKLALPSALL